MINQRKIAMIGDSLSVGGAERVHAILSKYFTGCGIAVSNCIFTKEISYEYGGTVLNLGEIAASDHPLLRKINRFNALRKFINANNFDVVIDFRMRQNTVQELLIAAIYPKNSIYTVHSSISEFYFPKSSQFIYRNHCIVTVSKAIRGQVLSNGFSTKVTVIHNPIENIETYSDASETPFILAVGRMQDDVKQFDKLILAYSKSVLPDRNIQLIILGEGPLQSKYQALVNELGLSNLMMFKGFTDPFLYYKHALFYVLSSRREGFPMGLIEALSSGIPVVAFDCASGPSEIIHNRENGLLVDNQDLLKMTEAMNTFVMDSDLYNHCKANATQSVKQSSIDVIGKQWLDYLKIDLN